MNQQKNRTYNKLSLPRLLKTQGTIIENGSSKPVSPKKRIRCTEKNDCICETCARLSKHVADQNQNSDDSSEDEPLVTKKRRKLNWAMEDDKNLLDLILKHNFAWDLILRDFKQFQHRRPNETEKSLEKRWKNLNSKQGKYNKGEYEGANKPFKASKKMTDIQREKEEAVHREKVFLFILLRIRFLFYFFFCLLSILIIFYFLELTSSRLPLNVLCLDNVKTWLPSYNQRNC